MNCVKGSNILFTLSLIVSAILAVISTAAPLRGQNEGDTTNPDQMSDIEAEMSFFELETKTVTSASKITQKTAEAPSIISVITRKQLNQYGWYSLNDAIYRQPGFAPSQDYDRRTVSSRGIFEGWNNNHYMLLFDGIQANDNAYGSAYTWDITPVSFIKSVEIVRGPGSALYGSYAMNGVFSVNTLSGEDLKGAIELGGRGGNNNAYTTNILTGNKMQYVSYLVSYDYQQTNGNQYRSWDDNLGDLKRTTRDGRSSHYVFTKLEGEGPLKGLEVQYHFQYWNFQTFYGWWWYIPDVNEAMHESRHLASIRYKTGKKFVQEYVVRFQRHDIDWNMQYYNLNVSPSFYPAGMWEDLKTATNDILIRAQLTYKSDLGFSVLGGAEYILFLYTGDATHYSNVFLWDTSLGNASYPPNPNNAMLPMGPWFWPVKDRPVHKIGVYAQIVSGKLFNVVEATVGVRYDRQFFEYRDTNFDYQVRRKAYEQLSPRASLVFSIAKDLVAKGMFGMAFREPTPSEIFADNTWTLNSNIHRLRPERVYTTELGLDWMIAKFLNWRGNAYWTQFENQIAYSEAAINRSDNVMAMMQTVGCETELLLEHKYVSGFANYSYSRRIKERRRDIFIYESGTTTWYPTHIFNAGITGKYKGAYLSLVGHYQGTVTRRISDFDYTDVYGSYGPQYMTYYDLLNYNLLRPHKVRSWFTLDAKIAYKIIERIELALTGTNLTNSRGKMVKVSYHPFDYQIEGWRLMGSVTLKVL